MVEEVEWTEADAARWVTAPRPDDDKYSRGVLGLVTGSVEYPGAAVLGVDAALHSGVGMVRYRGPVPEAVLARRPEAVTAAGRAQAWVLGSGQTPEAARGQESTDALRAAVPTVLDAGALGRVAEAAGPVVLTPHAGELAALTDRSRTRVAGDPHAAAIAAAARFSAVVLLKGHRSIVASPNGRSIAITAPTTWLATAGTGDSLAGILGALLATHPRAAEALVELAATACFVHGAAAASLGGPFPVLALNRAVPGVLARLLASRTGDARDAEDVGAAGAAGI